ncbi:UNVERIFIED_CONTAM: hypothetical protein NCL1_59236, partial [Trichonephila clavipes]
ITTISNSSGGWLVNNSHYIKSCNNTCILGCLSLSIVEISWDSDNSILNFLSKITVKIQHF